MPQKERDSIFGGSFEVKTTESGLTIITIEVSVTSYRSDDTRGAFEFEMKRSEDRPRR